ncbi:hypothetical protein J6590_078843 [Homalodisca vitripennis]|nr:hypothetical protein J6590_078843 [Homalodisca vitripennis]
MPHDSRARTFSIVIFKKILHNISRIGIYPLRQVGEVLVHTKIENREKKEGKEKGSNIPKRCLEPSSGVLTAENAENLRPAPNICIAINEPHHQNHLNLPRVSVVFSDVNFEHDHLEDTRVQAESIKPIPVNCDMFGTTDFASTQRLAETHAYLSQSFWSAEQPSDRAVRLPHFLRFAIFSVITIYLLSVIKSNKRCLQCHCLQNSRVISFDFYVTAFYNALSALNRARQALLRESQKNTRILHRAELVIVEESPKKTFLC